MIVKLTDMDDDLSPLFTRATDNFDFSLMLNLHTSGLHITPTRRAVLRYLWRFGIQAPSSIIHDLKNQGLSQSAIYDSLNTLTRAGLIEVVIMSFKKHYMLSRQLSGLHTHFITCRRCESRRPFHMAEFEKELQELLSRGRWTQTSHQLLVEGICHHCR